MIRALVSNCSSVYTVRPRFGHRSSSSIVYGYMRLYNMPSNATWCSVMVYISLARSIGVGVGPPFQCLP